VQTLNGYFWGFMVIFPNAKINIGLQVLDRRADGYHTISSVLYPIGLKDALEVIPQQDKIGSTFSVSGISIPGDLPSNICLMAEQLLSQDYPVPDSRVHLHKHIPIGAGLGGGSSDGAFMIRLLNDVYELGLAWGEMHHYARQLGSDCSFFVSNRPAIVSGRGELTESINLKLKGYTLVLVCPAVHVSTREAYSMVQPSPADVDLESFILQHPPAEWKEQVKNDFELPVFRKFPELGAIKEKLYHSGAHYAAMSGSGSAVFGLFAEPMDLKKAFPGCFVWAEQLTI
jgi:4-diphosphocytidyl-2-C-methyl-D-erythritol kinase